MQLIWLMSGNMLTINGLFHHKVQRSPSDGLRGGRKRRGWRPSLDSGPIYWNCRVWHGQANMANTNLSGFKVIVSPVMPEPKNWCWTGGNKDFKEPKRQRMTVERRDADGKSTSWEVSQHTKLAASILERRGQARLDRVCVLLLD